MITCNESKEDPKKRGPKILPFGGLGPRAKSF